jgi:hypothetical protein
MNPLYKNSVAIGKIYNNGNMLIFALEGLVELEPYEKIKAACEKFVLIDKGIQRLWLKFPTVKQLGFPEGTTLQKAIDAGLARGFTKCPSETCLHYVQQRNCDVKHGRSLLFVSDYIKDSDGIKQLFDCYRSHEDGRVHIMLIPVPNPQNKEVSPGDHLVFVESENNTSG